VPADESARILRAWGFDVTPNAEGDGQRLAVTPPSWRADVEGEADLVEEVLRIHGYDRIPTDPLPRAAYMPTAVLTPVQRRDRLIRRVLATRGLNEAVTWAFCKRDDAALFGGGDAALTLANPISADLDQMRPTPLPNLIAAAARNLDRGLADVALFEVGGGYPSASTEGQLAIACGLRVGAAAPRHWKTAASNRPVDAFDAKADVMAALEAIGQPTRSLTVVREAPDWYHPGRSGAIKLGPKTVVARFGELHPKIAEAFGLDAPAVAFEILLDALPLAKAKPGRAKPLLQASTLQPVSRDFAFILDRSVAADAVVRAARGADKALVTDVAVFDRYAGTGLPPDKISLGIAVTLQPTERTLTDAEIDAVASKIVAAVVQATGGVLRG
jgi:phenylalanyl-tRNA synthetase beta chain